MSAFYDGRPRDRDRETEETDRETDRETGELTDRETDRETGERKRQTERQMRKPHLQHSYLYKTCCIFHRSSLDTRRSLLSEQAATVIECMLTRARPPRRLRLFATAAITRSTACNSGNRLRIFATAAITRSTACNSGNRLRLFATAAKLEPDKAPEPPSTSPTNNDITTSRVSIPTNTILV